MYKPIAFLAMTSLLTSPVLGSVREAAFSSSSDRHGSQNSMFAGATYRVGFDRRSGEPRGRASLNVAGMTRTPTADFKIGQGLEIRGGRTGKPAFLLGGREIDLKNRKANLSSGATIAIVAVGVLAVGAVVTYYALRDPCDHKECE